MWKLLCFLLHIHLAQACTVGCPSGLFQYTQVKCNLWDAMTSQVPHSFASIFSTQGEFASHFSPPGSRCELLLVNISSDIGLEVSVSSAYIDRDSSLDIFECRSAEDCNIMPKLSWSGVAWNVQGFPVQETQYKFSISMQHPHLKIVLQVSASPSASNTFALTWKSGLGCQPCNDSIPQPLGFYETWAPYVKIFGCSMDSAESWVV